MCNLDLCGQGNLLPWWSRNFLYVLHYPAFIHVIVGSGLWVLTWFALDDGGRAVVSFCEVKKYAGNWAWCPLHKCRLLSAGAPYCAPKLWQGNQSDQGMRTQEGFSARNSPTVESLRGLPPLVPKGGLSGLSNWRDELIFTFVFYRNSYIKKEEVAHEQPRCLNGPSPSRFILGP
jgi:hypothetical protein